MEILRKCENSVNYDSIEIEQIRGVAVPTCRELQIIIQSIDSEIRIIMDTNEASQLIHLLGNCIDATWSPWSMDDKVITTNRMAS